MNREVHVRFWERLEVKLLRATRQNRTLAESEERRYHASQNRREFEFRGIQTQPIEKRLEMKRRRAEASAGRRQAGTSGTRVAWGGRTRWWKKPFDFHTHRSTRL